MPTVRPRWIVPCSSTPMILRTPSARRILIVAVPAAPTPHTTTLSRRMSLFTILSAFKSAAATTTDVPCWSSWKTGMSSSLRSRSSTEKQRGAEMSSRLMPPKAGAMSLTVSTILSGSFVSRQIGKASTPASSLKSMALPSITGMAASGPMSPSPSTAVPSVTTATVFCLIVSVKARCGSSRMARQTRATPGVYAIDRSSRVRIGTLLLISILPPRCIEKRPVRDVGDAHARDGLEAVQDVVAVTAVARLHGDVPDHALRRSSPPGRRLRCRLRSCRSPR